MCFGYDGEGALQRSLEEKGASRRNLFRGAALGAAGLAAVGSGLAVPAAARRRDDRGHGHGARTHGASRTRSASSSTRCVTRCEDRAGFDLVLNRLAQYGYEKVELAGNTRGRTAAAAADVPRRPRDPGVLEPRRAQQRRPGGDARQVRQRGDARAEVRRGAVPERPRRSRYWQDAGGADERRGRPGEEIRAALRLPQPRPRVHHRASSNGRTAVGRADRATSTGDMVHLEVDLYWAVTGGIRSGAGASDPLRASPSTSCGRRRSEVRQYHVKDRDAANGGFADLGTGVHRLRGGSSAAHAGRGVHRRERPARRHAAHHRRGRARLPRPHPLLIRLSVRDSEESGANPRHGPKVANAIPAGTLV